MTPMAWKSPEPRNVKRFAGSPLSSDVTCGLSIRTEVTMMTIPMRASPDARDSLCMSRYKDRGYDTHIVHSAMTNCRLPRRLRTGTLYRWGNIDRMTCGIVSPAISEQHLRDARAMARTDDDAKCAHALGNKVSTEVLSGILIHSPPKAKAN